MMLKLTKRSARAELQHAPKTYCRVGWCGAVAGTTMTMSVTPTKIRARQARLIFSMYFVGSRLARNPANTIDSATAHCCVCVPDDSSAPEAEIIRIAKSDCIVCSAMLATPPKKPSSVTQPTT